MIFGASRLVAALRTGIRGRFRPLAVPGPGLRRCTVAFCLKTLTVFLSVVLEAIFERRIGARVRSDVRASSAPFR